MVSELTADDSWGGARLMKPGEQLTEDARKALISEYEEKMRPLRAAAHGRN
jgi:hypothetical protein